MEIIISQVASRMDSAKWNWKNVIKHFRVENVFSSIEASQYICETLIWLKRAATFLLKTNKIHVADI